MVYIVHMCDNDFTGSFCIGFLVDTSLTNTAPLAYFHDITSAILGNITVEGGAPGSVILNNSLKAEGTVE